MKILKQYLAAAMLAFLLLECALPVQAASSAAAENAADTSVASSTADKTAAASGKAGVLLPAEPDVDIIYDFGGGQTYEVTTELAMTLMVRNADGSYYIDPKTGYYCVDENRLRAFESGLNAMFVSGRSGSGLKNGEFLTTSGRIIQIGVNLQDSMTIDLNSEFAYLPQAIMEQRHETHVPQIIPSGTYIEIDKTEQHLYYYKNGSLQFDTPVVTGNHARGSDTPSGVFKILSKGRNVSLTGPDYVSFVKYWMPFIGNSHGIHDASWRSNFSKNVYLTNGSHGCVNVPPANMEKLYPMVDVGTPVVIFQ